MKNKKEKLLNGFCIFITFVAILLLVLRACGVESIFGKYRIGFVMSESMEPAIPTYSLLFEKRFDGTRNIEVGDIVTFPYKMQDGDSIYVTHRIFELKDGYVVTKGDNNAKPDQFHTPYENIEYEVIFIFPYFLQSIAVLVFLGICLFYWNSRKKQTKEEVL